MIESNRKPKHPASKALGFAWCQPARQAPSHPAVTAPQLVGVLASAAAMGQRSWSGISSYIGHQTHTVDLVRLHDGELLVCTFPLLPVRGEQAPWKDAISAAGFGAFIGSGVNDPGLEPRSMPWCPSRLCCDG